MRKRILFLAVSLSVLSLSGQEIGKNFIDQNYIEVNGYAEKLITPNLIYLKILINEKDLKGKTLEETEKLMFAKLRDIGVDITKNVLVKDFISNFSRSWILKTDVNLIKEYEVLIYDAKTTCSVFIELEKLDISNISIEKLDNTDIEKYRQEVKLNAIQSAKEKAEALTTAINQKTGRALYISENTNNYNMAGALQGKLAGLSIRGMSSKSFFYGSSAPEPDAEFEKVKLQYNITVRFELQ